jgi:geranylgeranyl diphosphate synthase type II
VLAGADDAGVAAMAAYGQNIGAAFQITDDILDETGSEANLGKPVGSDAARNKNTYPSLLGLDKSRAAALAQADMALQALDSYEGPQAELLRGLAVYIVNRVS